jgi:hypothetical protein
MSVDLQKRFKELAKAEKIYEHRAPSQNDLSALFCIRASHLYLRPAGRLAFVLPMAALTRLQFEKFRSGRFGSYNIAWDEAWVMDDKVLPLFPVPSCVLFGRKRAIAKAVPDKVNAYSGSLPMRDAPEQIADVRLTVVNGAAAPAVAQADGGSPYRELFRCGANLFPRMLVLVERKLSGRLGVDPQAPLVSSRRNALEKPPWAGLPSIEHKVETDFLRPVLMGESILPYRLFQSFEGVVPTLSTGVLLTSESAADRGYAELATWLRAAESAWNNTGKQTRLFGDQINYINQLSAQFPLAPLRVLYAKAGTLPAAMVLRDDQAVIDHKLYWGAPSCEVEAHFLVAILNSETARSRAERYQSRGIFGARDFDKVMFNLPIPLFDAGNPLHRDLSEAGAHAELVAGMVELVEGERFQRARKRVRDALAEEGIGGEIEKLVEKLLDG